MKNLLFLYSIILLTVGFNACADGGEGDTPNAKAVLASQMDSMCYAVGASFGKSAKATKMNLNPAQVRKGYLECKQGQSYINEQNAREITTKLQLAARKQQAAKPDADPSEGILDSLSYAMGGSYYYQLKTMGVELNDDALVQGIVDNLQEGASKLDDLQMRALLGNFRNVSEAARAKKNTAAAVANKAAGKTFMAEKAKESGVKSTASGLHYKVLKTGTGASPKATDKVSVHYEGRLIDGTIFDSSIKRGKPAEFFLNKVIKGWTEGLQLMKAGSKFQFYIPSDLAYGDRGSGQKIGPGATLIFDVELLEIK